MELEVFKRFVLRFTLPIVMVQHGFVARGNKRGSLVAKVRGLWQRNAVFILLSHFVMRVCTEHYYNHVDKKGGKVMHDMAQLHGT